MNPLKKAKLDAPPPEITAATVVSIPSSERDWEQALQVAAVALESARSTLQDVPHELVVFDDASCAPVRMWLRQALARGDFDLLLGSAAEVSKVAALNRMMPACRAPIFCYFDSDVLFREGWYQHSHDILDAFPAVGMVSVLLGRPAQPELSSATMRFVQADDETKMRSGGAHDVVIRRRGVDVVPGAEHAQFLMPREVVQGLLPLPDSEADRGAMTVVDRRVNELGFLRLSAIEPLALVLGKELGSRRRALLDEAAPRAWQKTKAHRPGRRQAVVDRALRVRPIRWGLETLQKRLFDLLYLTEDAEQS